MYHTIITPLELSKISGKTIIIDCRSYLSDAGQGRREYAEGHIPNAIHAHLDEDLSGAIIKGTTGRHPLPSIEKAVALFSKFGIDKETQVVAYCSFGGGIAARLWWMLRWLGHENVAVLDGGWQTWKTGGFPISTTVPTLIKSDFIARPNADLSVGVKTLQQHIEQKDKLIIDSRTAPRYKGEAEPIDPIAGHIPTAINFPWTENLNATKQFLDKKSIQKRFEPILSQHIPTEMIFYCGSGVTACHNILALHHAGFEGAKLYAGSWSEWITEEKREIVLMC